MSTFGPEDFDDYDYYDELDDDFDDLGAGLPLDEDDKEYAKEKRRKNADTGSCSDGCCSAIFIPIIIVAAVIALIKSCVGG